MRRIADPAFSSAGDIKPGKTAARTMIALRFIKIAESGRRAYVHQRAVYQEGIDHIGAQSVVGGILNDVLRRVAEIDPVQSFIGPRPKVIPLYGQGAADIAGQSLLLADLPDDPAIFYSDDTGVIIRGNPNHAEPGLDDRRD